MLNYVTFRFHSRFKTEVLSAARLEKCAWSRLMGLREFIKCVCSPMRKEWSPLFTSHSYSKLVSWQEVKSSGVCVCVCKCKMCTKRKITWMIRCVTVCLKTKRQKMQKTIASCCYQRDKSLQHMWLVETNQWPFGVISKVLLLKVLTRWVFNPLFLAHGCILLLCFIKEHHSVLFIHLQLTSNVVEHLRKTNRFL